MNLGGSTSRGSSVPKSQTTSFDQISEVNKKLRQLDKNLCCKLEEIAENTKGGGEVTINSSCESPVFVQLCDSSGEDKELVFTTSVPICVDNGDDTFSTWTTRERIIWDSVTSAVISRTPEFSQDGVTWVTTAPSLFKYGACAPETTLDDVVESLDQIYQAVDGLELSVDNIKISAENIDLNTDDLETKIEELKTINQSTITSFQVKDCNGDNVGPPENVNQTIILNKLVTRVCNTTDISNPIISAITAQTTALQVARTHDLLQTPPMAIGDTLTIPPNKFATVSLLVVKGEFTIANTSNDFSTDVVLSSGTINPLIEISEDGVGTASGATNLPQGLDTRSNANDLNKAGNAYLITAVRENSIIQLDLYK
jgi:hypothetical protein